MKLSFAIILTGLALAVVSTVKAATITFEAPTEREDNTPLTPSEIAGFNVYTSTGEMVKQLAGDARTFDFPASSVTQSLYLTTVDTDGRESVYSQAAVIPKLIADPKPPVILSVE